MEVTRQEDGGTTIRLDEQETRDLLGAAALSMAAYGILQNFMTLEQKTMTLPSLTFIARLGATIAPPGTELPGSDDEHDDGDAEQG
jgi:hypothetical protein